MDTQNKNRISPAFSLSHFLTFPLSRLHTCSRGFTLIEVLVTLSIIALMGSVAGTLYYKNYRDEVGYEATLQSLDTIKKVILGANIPHNRGVHISGYVADMGTLPHLNSDNQPEGLWRRTTGFVESRYYEDERIRAGWNGPYIEAPETGALTDGWGTPLIFRKDTPYDLTIISYGADMKLGGTGIKEDITLRIAKHHYMAPLGLRVRGLKADILASELIINYPDPTSGALKSEELETDEFGHFVSDEDLVFPIGLRSISAKVRHGSEIEEKVIVFPIQPGMNYMGTIE